MTSILFDCHHIRHISSNLSISVLFRRLPSVTHKKSKNKLLQVSQPSTEQLLHTYTRSRDHRHSLHLTLQEQVRRERAYNHGILPRYLSCLRSRILEDVHQIFSFQHILMEFMGHRRRSLSLKSYKKELKLRLHLILACGAIHELTTSQILQSEVRDTRKCHARKAIDKIEKGQGAKIYGTCGRPGGPESRCGT
jgi:hypothetical protein